MPAAEHLGVTHYDRRRWRMAKAIRRLHDRRLGGSRLRARAISGLWRGKMEDKRRTFELPLARISVRFIREHSPPVR